MRSALVSTLSRNRHLGALLLGLVLGQVVTLMAARDGANMLGFGVSTVFVASATASFVLFVLGQQGASLPRAVMVRQAQGLVAVTGLGLLASLLLFA
jgi:hypothetical protein